MKLRLHLLFVGSLPDHGVHALLMLDLAHPRRHSSQWRRGRVVGAEAGTEAPCSWNAQQEWGQRLPECGRRVAQDVNHGCTGRPLQVGARANRWRRVYVHPVVAAMLPLRCKHPSLSPPAGPWGVSFSSSTGTLGPEDHARKLTTKRTGCQKQFPASSLQTEQVANVLYRVSSFRSGEEC